MTPLLIMFGTAFLAATLLPFYSEVALVAFIMDGQAVFPLWIAATTGNTLGSAVNYALGRYLLRFEDRSWFPFKGKTLERGQRWFNKFGKWSLLLAWAPVGGDALTYIAGLMKVRIALFLVLVGIGKGARYAAVVYLIEKI